MQIDSDIGRDRIGDGLFYGLRRSFRLALTEACGVVLDRRVGEVEDVLRAAGKGQLARRLLVAAQEYRDEHGGDRLQPTLFGLPVPPAATAPGDEAE